VKRYEKTKELKEKTVYRTPIYDLQDNTRRKTK